MNLDLVKSQGLAQQYATLLSSSQFMDAIKSASKNDKTGKYNSLLKNLEKLGNSIEENNNDSNVTETESGESLSLLKSIETVQSNNNVKSNRQNAAIDEAMRKAIDELIAKAELMESMLDLEVSPPEEDLNDLLAAFRGIITQLDADLRKLHNDVKDKKTKEEFTLRPSSDTKSGFQESISLVAK